MIVTDPVGADQAGKHGSGSRDCNAAMAFTAWQKAIAGSMLEGFGTFSNTKATLAAFVHFLQSSTTSQS